MGHPPLDGYYLRGDLGFTGFGIAKLSPEEQAEMLAEIEEEKRASAGATTAPAVETAV